jgi:hypothetical protein
VQMDRIRLELDAHLLQCEASLNRRIRHYEDRFNAALRCAACVVLPQLALRFTGRACGRCDVRRVVRSAPNCLSRQPPSAPAG